MASWDTETDFRPDGGETINQRAEEVVSLRHVTEHHTSKFVIFERHTYDTYLPTKSRLLPGRERRPVMQKGIRCLFQRESPPPVTSIPHPLPSPGGSGLKASRTLFQVVLLCPPLSRSKCTRPTPAVGQIRDEGGGGVKLRIQECKLDTSIYIYISSSGEMTPSPTAFRRVLQ